MSSSAPPPSPPFYSSGQVREWSRSQWAGLASPINAIKIILLGHLQSPIFQVILDFVKGMFFFSYLFICWGSVLLPFVGVGVVIAKPFDIWPPTPWTSKAWCAVFSTWRPFTFFCSRFPVGRSQFVGLTAPVGPQLGPELACSLCCLLLSLNPLVSVLWLDELGWTWVCPPKFMCWRPQLQGDGSFRDGV